MPLFLAQVRGCDGLQIGETMFVAGAGHVPVPRHRRPARAPGIDLRVMLAAWAGDVPAAVSGRWRISPSTSAFWELFGPQALRGAAMMFIMLPVNQVALGRLPALRVEDASGLYNLMRNLGGAVGLAAITPSPRAAAGAARSGDLDEQVTWAQARRCGSFSAGDPDAGADHGQKRAERIWRLCGKSPGWSRQQALSLASRVLLLMSPALLRLPCR